MKILYLTTVDPRSQGDYQEVMILNGLRSILGNNCIDYPRKKIMYCDYSDSPKNQLHGSGFTLYTKPIKDVSDRSFNNIDVIIYGVTNAYGITDYSHINNMCENIFYIDGHDDPNIRKRPCFKRELYQECDGVYQTGFGIPYYQIRPINIESKIQLIQKTAPMHSIFQEATDLGTRFHYIYTNESDYYDDMSISWFGLTSKKGGWDSLRHYEIMASGTLLLFRDYDKKPIHCSPQNLPCYSYSTKEELDDIMNKLIINNKPTDEYMNMLFKQREWLLKYGTTESRALAIIQKIQQIKK